MNTSIRATIILALLLLTTISSVRANGCIITQTDQAAYMLMTSGKVSQTFTACRTGTLEYLTLYVNSNDAEHFSARITVESDGQAITRQQVVIPSAYRNDHVKLRLAEAPVVKAGKHYSLTLEVPTGHTINVAYTDADHYTHGHLKVNGNTMSGDLAFEAGVKAYSDRLMGVKSDGECQPMQLSAQDAVEEKSLVAQSFTMCEASEILGITLFYKSNVDFSGFIDIFRSGVQEEQSLGALAFSASASPAGFVIATPEDEIILDTPDLYEFRLRDFAPEREDEVVLFSIGQNNPYPEGALISALGPSSDDLMFQVIYETLDEEHEAPSYEVLSDYKNHDCVIAQPYYNEHETFEQGTLRISLDICDDGKLEELYLKAELEQSETSIRFSLLDDRGKIVRRGELSSADMKDGVLRINLEDAPVIFYYNYTLELEIPERTTLKLGTSDRNESHSFKSTFNDRSVSNAIALAVGMRPYQFETNEETDTALSLTLFPNPFTTQLFVDVHNIEGSRAAVTLYGFHGNELFTTVITGTQATERVEIIPQQHLERGFYTVRVESGNDVVIETAVKQ